MSVPIPSTRADRDARRFLSSASCSKKKGGNVMLGSSLNGLDENLNSTMTDDPGWSAHISSGLFDRGLPEIRPVDIRTQILTSNLSGRCLFDFRAVLGWNVVSAQPVIDYLRCALDTLGQRALRSEMADCFL